MKLHITILFTVILLIGACGDLKTTSYFSQPADPIAGFNAVEVHDFESRIEKFPDKALVDIPQTIADKLQSSGTFSTAKRGTVDNVPAGETIVLLGEVTDFQSAGDVEYEGGALKFGEVEITISLAMVEKDTGREIVSGEVSSFSSMGFLSGDVFGEKLYDQIADEVLEFVSKNK